MSLFFEENKPNKDAKNFKVKCIDDSLFASDIIVEGELVEGRIYNVEGVVETANGHGFNLTGMKVRHISGAEMAFSTHRFKVLK